MSCSSLIFYLDSSNMIPSHIMTYLAAFFALPVKRANGQILSHEEVINALDNETVEYEANLGVSGIYQELLHISIKVETSRYEEAVAWLSDVVYRSQFNKERYNFLCPVVERLCFFIDNLSGWVLPSPKSCNPYRNTNAMEA
jgi:Zn-dependent M16 (insulinase) family peptidase